MSDQCKPCTLRGDLSACARADCGHHDTWYARQLRIELNKAWATQREVVKMLTDIELTDGKIALDDEWWTNLKALINKYKEPQ